MRQQKFALAPALVLGLFGLGALTAGCKDDDPCDPDQTERHGQCYATTAGAGGTSISAAEAGAANAGGANAAGAGDATAGAPSAGPDTPVGTPCQDTSASSDCGGAAPVCADLTPLGQGIMCTQLDCADGEAHAGACPSGFTCFAVPGYPSVCIKQ